MCHPPLVASLWLEQLQLLEHALRAHQHWQPDPPPATALASPLPFAVDTLSCPQWLQWIFIPKLRTLIAQQLPLPSNLNISPYLEQALCPQQGRAEICAIMRQLEQLS